MKDEFKGFGWSTLKEDPGFPAPAAHAQMGKPVEETGAQDHSPCGLPQSNDRESLFLWLLVGVNRGPCSPECHLQPA